MAENKVVNSYDITIPNLGKVYIGMRGFFKVKPTTKNVNRKCTLCGGNRTVKLKGVSYQCPKCRGNTTGEHWYSYKHYEFNEYFLSSIEIINSYAQDIYPLEKNDKIGVGSLKFHLSNRNYDKRGYNSGLDYKGFTSYLILSEEEAMKKLDYISDYYFIDEALCRKIQRLLNKKEKEGIQQYVEEAKQLKEEATEFEYEV